MGSLSLGIHDYSLSRDRTAHHGLCKDAHMAALSVLETSSLFLAGTAWRVSVRAAHRLAVRVRVPCRGAAARPSLASGA